MSYLEMAKQAEARLRAEREATGANAIDAVNAESPGRAHVAEALPFLSMPIAEFQARGACLEVRVPWLPVTLWMVPTDRDAAALTKDGISRGRIWTASELMQIMAIQDRTPSTVKTLTHAKIEMDGDLIEVRPRRPAGGGPPAGRRP